MSGLASTPKWEWKLTAGKLPVLHTGYLQKMSEFNVIDSLSQGIGCTYQCRSFTGTWTQFWSDVM